MQTRPPATRPGAPGSAPPHPGTVRLLIAVVAAVGLGGAGLAYTWTSLNALLAGTASAGRIAGAVVVLTLVLLLVLWLGRYLSRLAPR